MLTYYAYRVELFERSVVADAFQRGVFGAVVYRLDGV